MIGLPYGENIMVGVPVLKLLRPWPAATYDDGVHQFRHASYGTHCARNNDRATEAAEVSVMPESAALHHKSRLKRGTSIP